MDKLVELDRYRLQVQSRPLDPPATRRTGLRAPRPREGEHYLRGPIPMSWFLAAARLPGRALHVGMWVWYRVGLNRGAGQVDLNLSALADELECDRATASRGLRALENAGLVASSRPPGRKVRVVVLAAPE